MVFNQVAFFTVLAIGSIAGMVTWQLATIDEGYRPMTRVAVAMLSVVATAVFLGLAIPV